MIEAVVNFSGGAGSYVAAKRTIDRFGGENVVLLFCDTKTEDVDLYRFLDDCELILPTKLVRVADGRDIWQLFSDVRYLGNTRVAPCSTTLKRLVGDRWVDENAPNAVQVFGIGVDEAHRAKRIKERLGDLCWFPLLESPLPTKRQMIREIEQDGIDPPRLYALGAPHNNCGGGCVKAGMAHWRWLYNTLPCEYAKWEQNEQKLREQLGKDISILRDRTGGQVKPLTLEQFRKRIESKTPTLWEEEWGGCGCFLED